MAYAFFKVLNAICQELENLRFHPTCKLTRIARHSSVDTGRRHETPKSERTDFITQGIAHNKSLHSHIPSLCIQLTEIGPHESYTLHWFASRLRIFLLQKHQTFFFKRLQANFQKFWPIRKHLS